MAIAFVVEAQRNNHALMRVLKPIGTARELPNTCYINPAIFAFERQGGARKGRLAFGL